MQSDSNQGMLSHLAMDLVRCTEFAALQSVHWAGRGDKEGADGAAVDALRTSLNEIEMDGIVVIGEGDKDQAPMLFHGERLGTGRGPKVDIAVDPVEGTRPLANGQPGAVSIVALAERDSLYKWQQIAYMEKLAVGDPAGAVIDIRKSPTENLQAIASAKNIATDQLSVALLDRPRHEHLLAEIRATGARVVLIADGDIAAAFMTAVDGSGIDVLMGTGGAPEAVLASAGLKCLGGAIQTRLWPRNDEERQLMAKHGIDASSVMDASDLVRSSHVCVSATAITDSGLLAGVRRTTKGITTHSLMLDSWNGTIRQIRTTHRQ